MGDRAKSISDDKVLIEDVIITDGKGFHQRIKVIIFLPELAHAVSSFNRVYRVPSDVSIEAGFCGDL